MRITRDFFASVLLKLGESSMTLATHVSCLSFTHTHTHTVEVLGWINKDPRINVGTNLESLRPDY